jgi:diguanylate cyclase (GGDEF)-like protein
MSVVGASWAVPGRRRVWVALATGQVLYLIGDVYWVYAENVLDVLPYPSWGDAAYLVRYAACATALCWLVRGRQAGRDRAAFLDAAILTSAFALPAVMFLVVPAVSGSDASLLSHVVATAYPLGDVLVLAVLVRLVLTPAARNVAFTSLSAGLMILLATDVYYIRLTSANALLPPWADVAYASSYLLIGFAAMHPSSGALTEPVVPGMARPVAARIMLLGGASLLPPLLGISLALAHVDQNPLMIAVGGAVSSGLVLVRLSDLLRDSQLQSVLLEAVARTDALTGLPNRRTWDHELARASELARSDGTSLTIATLDLDDFKSYNDTEGHLAGDLALKETAAAWAEVLDGHGFLARYGGDEFAMFLPSTDHAVVEALLLRLHEAVPRGQACSIGFTTWLPGEGDVQAIARADEAMYMAKRTGRNRTVFLEPDTHH